MIFFVSKLERKLVSRDWDTINHLNEVADVIKSFELSLDEWYMLHGRLKGLFSETYVENFNVNFQNVLKRVSVKLDGGKIRLHSLREEEARNVDEMRAQEEQDRLRVEQNRRDSEVEIQVAEYKCCKLLSSTLCASCRVDVKHLADYHLSDLKTNVTNFTFELREILIKITSFFKLVPHCGVEGQKMTYELWELRDASVSEVTQSSNELGSLIRERGITEEKLRNGLGLQIQLPKFKRYDSEMDVYSFRSEFEKLIQPTVRRQFWADYLKRNYLADSALTFVEKLEGIDRFIWQCAAPLTEQSQFIRKTSCIVANSRRCKNRRGSVITY